MGGGGGGICLLLLKGKELDVLLLKRLEEFEVEVMQSGL